MQTLARPGSSAEETRARILAATKDVYEANGTRGTTTRVVAERAGVNEATIFRHFGNKQALLMAMREHSCGADVFESVMGSLTGKLSDDLRTIAGSLVDRMRGQRSMMCISLAEEATGSADIDPEWRGPRRILDRLRVFFRSHAERGEISGDIERLPVFFMGILFSYVVAQRLWGSEKTNPRDLDFIVSTFLNGVK